MIAIKNVLVATDFGEPAASALAYGRELARSYGAALHVLHVVDDLRWRYALDMPPMLSPELQDQLFEYGRASLDTLITDEDRSQLHARSALMLSGATADTIVEYARNAAIDLIVIGTHGRRGLTHALMGSVAERVVRLAPCPVLTVREHEREIMAPDALASVAAQRS